LHVVKGDSRPYFVLDGEPVGCDDECLVRYVARLIEANGEEVSFAGWLKGQPAHLEGTIITRLWPKLPERIASFIVRGGKGKSPKINVELLYSAQ
jgi:hypothetical protein